MTSVVLHGVCYLHSSPSWMDCFRVFFSQIQCLRFWDSLFFYLKNVTPAWNLGALCGHDHQSLCRIFQNAPTQYFLLSSGPLPLASLLLSSRLVSGLVYCSSLLPGLPQAVPKLILPSLLSCNSVNTLSTVRTSATKTDFVIPYVLQGKLLTLIIEEGLSGGRNWSDFRNINLFNLLTHEEKALLSPICRKLRHRKVTVCSCLVKWLG